MLYLLYDLHIAYNWYIAHIVYVYLSINRTTNMRQPIEPSWATGITMNFT